MNRNTTRLLGLSLFGLIAALAVAGPLLSGYSYDGMDLAVKNAPPSSAHWFGTDDLGRDMFTRVWMGARLSLLVGVGAAFIDMVIGFLWGSLAALSSRRIDGVLMRIADILFALPYLLIVILAMVAMGPGLLSILFSMTILGWITMARVVRGQVIQIKEMDYILASKALGANYWQVVWWHILPNTREAILATLALTIPQAIFTEAFLSFLGLGVQAPLSSLGTMSSEAMAAFTYYPWRLFFPASLITLSMLAFNLIGEGLNHECQ